MGMRPSSAAASQRQGVACVLVGALLVIGWTMPRHMASSIVGFRGDFLPSDLPGSTEVLFRPVGATQATQAQSQTATPALPSADTLCPAEYPWIGPALEGFFQPARESAQESIQTSEQSLAAIDEITWMDGYHPGHDLVTLRFNHSTQRYDLTSETRSPHNRQYKRDCMLEVLKAAVTRFSDDLAVALDRRELRFVFETEDFGIIWTGAKSKLPAFSMSTDAQHVDIPVPDFTYGCYPETRYANSSWPAVAELLRSKAAMVGWRDRHSGLFHRSNWGVGPRRGLMPLLADLHANASDVALLGASADVGDTGFEVSNTDSFVWLDAQCDHKFHIHTAGFSYSAALKYKLACASVVFKFESKFVEFYEPALHDGVHVVTLPAKEDGVDVDDFFENSAPKIKAAVQASIDQTDLPAMAAAAQRFALHDLSPQALSCYWYEALVRYADLYFMERPAGEEERASEEERKESAAARKPRRRKKGGKGGGR